MAAKESTFDWGEFLFNYRNAVLDAVVRTPLYPYPGPPPGMEGRPSASYMGEAACMRKAWFNLQSREEGFPYDELPRQPELEVAPQCGWALENILRHWLASAECSGIFGLSNEHTYNIVLDEFFEPLIGPEGLYYGHPDGEGILIQEDETEVAQFILEYKHQRSMAYMKFLRQGVAEAEPLYYAQAQAYMLASGLGNTLFVIRPFDVSSVKGDIAMGKRRKDYSGELEPDFRMIPKSSGVNPAIYLELVPAMPAYQRFLLSWCRKLVDHVENGSPPDRLHDTKKDWQCAYCQWLPACLSVGPCSEPDCGHTGCVLGAEVREEEFRPRG